jgi:hypothetical protein
LIVNAPVMALRKRTVVQQVCHCRSLLAQQADPGLAHSQGFPQNQ